MASVDKLIKIILRAQNDMGRDIDNANSSLSKFGKTATSVGVGLSASLTAPLVAIGAAGVKMATDLDKSLRNISTIGGETDAELSALRETFLDMSTDMTKSTDSAQALADAYYGIESAGFRADGAMSVLEASTKAAAAGLSTTETAASAVTTVLNSYNLSAGQATRVSDIMFQTVKNGVGTYEQLAGSLGKVVGTAASVGVGFDEVSAAIATMSTQGLTFSEASTALNQAMLAFLKPSTDMQKAITELGYSSGQAMIEAEGFGGAMAKLDEYTGGSTEEMAKLFGNVKALDGALKLTGQGAETFSNNLDDMANSAGASQEAFELQMKSFDAQFKNFQNTMNAMFIDIGTILLPIVNDFLQNFIKPIIEGFRSLPEPVKGFIVIVGLLIAALGPLLIIVGAIASGIAALTSVMAGIGIALSPILLLIGALIALGIAIAMVASNWEQISVVLLVGLNQAVRVAEQLATLFQVGFVNALRVASQAAQQLATLFQLGFVNALRVAAQTAQQLAQLLVQKFAQMSESVKTHINALGGAIGRLPQMMSLGFDAVKQWVSNIVNGIKTGLGALVDAVKIIAGNIMQGLIDGVKQKATQFVNAIKQMANDTVNAAKSAFGISSPSKVMMAMGQNIVQGFDKGLQAMGGLTVPAPTIEGMTAGGGAGVTKPLLSATAPSVQAPLGGFGGGGNVNIQNVNVPPGTTREQIQYIMKEIGKEVKRKGGINS